VINVIVPHYKHAQYLPEAITAILNQTGNWLGHILLMNDDPAIDLSWYEFIDERIKVFQDGRNEGQAYRFNEAIGLSSVSSGLYPSKMVAFTSADDMWLPWKLAMSMKLAHTGPAEEWPHVIYTDAIMRDHDNNQAYYKSRTFDSEALMLNNYIVASTVICNTRVAEIIRFDDRLHYGEDWLFYHGCHCWGAKFKYVSVPTLYYRDNTSTIGVRYGTDHRAKKLELIQRINKLYEPKTAIAGEVTA